MHPLVTLGVLVGSAALVGRVLGGSWYERERDALGRVIRSETGSYSEAERFAVGWVTRNRAAHQRTSIVGLVCTPTCGPGGHGRWASSRQPATLRDLATAGRVLGGLPSDDPSRGAIDAFEPALQDRLYAAGRYSKSAAMVRADWLRSYDHYATIGHWELYGPKGGR